ncbi:c-type cytochrome [Cognatazoarcus halotolerans]|uniref:c-type cytochrome n=1 Tax=Cognatazoarcus halotolerans TaxID=2686016 RepID=UPI00135AB569|nr:c-type cytochrome [Cognatazoarcus halotolerans]MBX3679694.1 cytochrome c5 family protein [Rhodocyclaceae bacterium]MCB1900914.1 cytochrome c5 family protein [Rhodocyclaceae bacterium]MCP5311737.1 cytochrome c5 family protein [Zoogloeaceae bacterium]
MSVSRDLSPAKRIARLALPVSALLAVGLLAGCGKAQSIDYEKSAELIQPVAKVDLKPVTVAPGSRTGEQVVTSVCGACHASGALNAPKIGDAGAWGPRIAQGFDALVKAAINGKNQMPPKGGAADLTDTEIARAVAFMADKAGAKFPEPQ